MDRSEQQQLKSGNRVNREKCFVDFVPSGAGGRIAPWRGSTRCSTCRWPATTSCSGDVSLSCCASLASPGTACRSASASRITATSKSLPALKNYQLNQRAYRTTEIQRRRRRSSVARKTGRRPLAARALCGFQTAARSVKHTHTINQL